MPITTSKELPSELSTVKVCDGFKESTTAEISSFDSPYSSSGEIFEASIVRRKRDVNWGGGGGKQT
uniref:Uncharacterized protein n=1 Tax=Lepeophtheirus salmonis TaxID=72036 RepID=A0A0K2UXU8_LEPSM